MRESEVQVQYEGILPDLFREDQGVIARGELRDDGVFVAEEVLAKHDENYMPPEVAEVVAKAHAEAGVDPDTAASVGTGAGVIERVNNDS